MVDEAPQRGLELHRLIRRRKSGKQGLELIRMTSCLRQIRSQLPWHPERKTEIRETIKPKFLAAAIVLRRTSVFFGTILRKAKRLRSNIRLFYEMVRVVRVVDIASSCCGD